MNTETSQLYNKYLKKNTNKTSMTFVMYSKLYFHFHAYNYNIAVLQTLNIWYVHLEVLVDHCITNDIWYKTRLISTRRHGQ